MQSTHPIPGDPWPPDMILSIEGAPREAVEMLWVRDAFELEADGDVPPPLIDTPAPAAHTLDETERVRWQAAWPALWARVVAHAGRPTDFPAVDRLWQRDLPQEERAALLAEVMSPSWREEFGDGVFDDASFRDVQERASEARRTARPHSFADLPERRDVEALVPAWRQGLVRIVVIPCRGAYVRSLGATGLLVTPEVRADSAAYRAALASFIPTSSS
ncbi:hypothetical protein J2X55_003450 [Microbacterium sp. 1154]|uniref:hypothetical protein n=1 Tax=Microbacterium sp. 1154 TaxID=2817733 RepID=UPI002861D84A|nr:hypothetical protein [Microbacterium sp. 1154]MDR6692505.1 hypothetical protein [Microbacterium sp. 1154]